MNFIKKTLRFLFFVAISAFIGWYIGFLSQVQEISPLKKTVNVNSDENGGHVVSQPVRKFPELQDPKDIEYKWNYNGKEYSLKLTLYQSVYDFYRSSPKDYVYSGDLPANWEEDYYGMFLKLNPIDQTISQLAASIEELGKKNRLSEEQIVELATAFVQGIPYDNAKAKIIEGGSDEVKPMYPYEILYENLGVCSEKSFLLNVILRQMGYGTALFEYKEAKHLAAAVKCPSEFSSYSSGYCYIETTQPGHRIGVVPELGKEDNLAILRGEKKSFNEDEGSQVESKKLGEGKIFQKQEGRIYTGILYTIKTQSKIDELEAQIAQLKGELAPIKERVEQKSNEMEEFTSKMNDWKKSKNYEEYNQSVPTYNKAIENLKKETTEYNSKINTYNQKVTQYNRLIKEFYD